MTNYSIDLSAMSASKKKLAEEKISLTVPKRTRLDRPISDKCAELKAMKAIAELWIEADSRNSHFRKEQLEVELESAIAKAAPDALSVVKKVFREVLGSY